MEIYVTFRHGKFHAATTLKGISRIANASYSTLQKALKGSDAYRREKVFVQRVELVKKVTPNNGDIEKVIRRMAKEVPTAKSSSKRVQKAEELLERGLINEAWFDDMIMKAEESDY